MQFVMHYPLNKTPQIPLYHQFFIQLFRTFFSFSFYCSTNIILLVVFSLFVEKFAHTITLRTCQRKITDKSNSLRESSKTPFYFHQRFSIVVPDSIYFGIEVLLPLNVCMCVCACFFLFAKISLFAIVPRLAYEIRFAIMMIVSALVSIAHNVSFIMNSL